MRVSIIILSLLFVYCSERKSARQDLRDVMIEICSEQEISDRTIVIVPQTGCPGCITKAFLFLKDITDAGRKDVLFVINNISDKKLLRNRLSSYYMESPCVCLDMSNQLIEKGYHSIYPQVYFYESDQIVEQWTMDPDNNDKWDLLKNKRL
jgi:hypothetical protein